MQLKRKELTLNFKFMNWKYLLLIVIVCFYFIVFGAWVRNGHFYSDYGIDYLAFWSAGKIADEKGYAEIYDLENLRGVQIQQLQSLGFPVTTEDISIQPLPVALFSFFVLPFQFLSRVSLVTGYWIWTTCNLIILIWYLIFFLRKILPENGKAFPSLNLVFLMLISYPVFYNMELGQDNVLILVCAGEFIRYAICKKPLYSGIWLGGMLLKPHLLIIIVPMFVMLRNWKVILGFLVSSGVILTTSLFLSGLSGMQSLVNLWTKYLADIVYYARPEIMINWRMVGVNWNSLLNTSLGWIIAWLGIGLTIMAVCYLIKRDAPFGSQSWIIFMLGVFSATIVITWHSHFYMALVLIPFLVYASVYELLSEKIIITWAIMTPITWFVIGISGLFFPVLNRYQGLFVVFSGFILNLVILISILLHANNRGVKKVAILED